MSHKTIYRPCRLSKENVSILWKSFKSGVPSTSMVYHSWLLLWVIETFCKTALALTQNISLCCGILWALFTVITKFYDLSCMFILKLLRLVFFPTLMISSTSLFYGLLFLTWPIDGFIEFLKFPKQFLSIWGSYPWLVFMGHTLFYCPNWTRRTNALKKFALFFFVSTF